MTQKEIVFDSLRSKVVATIRQIQDVTNLPQPTIRRILGQGAKTGELERLVKGVYTLKTKDGQTASIIKSGDAKEEIKNLVKERARFDMIFLDPPYIIPGAKGGNRNLTKYDLMTPAEFNELMKDVSKLTKNENTPIYFMFSASKTNTKALKEYYKAFSNAGLIECCKSSKFQKLYKNGKPFSFCGHVLQEHIFVFSRSGNTRKDINFELEPIYSHTKDSNYQTAKPTSLLIDLIKASTKPFETILDLFAGSGSTVKACARTNRNILAYEINEQQAENIQKEIKQIQNEVILDESPDHEHDFVQVQHFSFC